MYFTKNIRNITRKIFISVFCLCAFGSSVQAQKAKAGVKAKKTEVKALTHEDSLAVHYVEDTAVLSRVKKPTFKWSDRITNRLITKQPESPLLLLDPKNIKNDFVLKPDNKGVSVYEKIGKYDYKAPQDISFKEFYAIQNQMVRSSLIRDYARTSDGQSFTSGRGIQPLLAKSPLADKIFGGDGISRFRPNGFITLDVRAGSQFIDNPALPIIARRITIFDVDPQFNFNVNGGIGSKLGMLTNFDTKNAFSFENQLRLNYKSDPENILQKIEAGNVSLQLNSKLISSVQSLFGLKSSMKLGNSNIQVVAAQQRSRTETIVLRNGQQSKNFEIRCDQYDENRHYFLGHFFRENYENALRNLPLVASGVKITRVEVYATNRTSNYETMRNIVAFADLGESKPHAKALTGKKSVAADNKTSNNLFDLLGQNDAFRQADRAKDNLSTLGNGGLAKGEDYELLRGARRLSDREYRLNSDLGYISLISALRNDEVLAVAYEYTYNGQTFKVGELMEDYSVRREDEVIALKLLKSATIRNRLDLPMWHLMMKNVYSLPTASINKQGFQLRVIYKDDQTGIDAPNLQEGRKLQNVPLVQVLNLDKLNSQLDPQKDGNFDFVEGITIDSRNGKVIFPLLEPFGKHLAKQFDTDESLLKQKYVFNELYSGTLQDAQQITTKNKFFLSGNYQAGSVNEVNLPLGVEAQSVRVSAGGMSLSPNTDYIVDAQAGRLRFLNPSVLNSAREIRVEYEKPEIFMNQTRGLFGVRFDHQFSKDLVVGFTTMAMRESVPQATTRVALGQEPVNNTIFGADLTYKKQANWLTRTLDALPVIQTKEPSLVQFQGEYAKLFPGTNKTLRKRADNSVMIDEFEAARNVFDLARMPTRWKLGSTPEKFVQNGPLGYNYRRAKMSVYRIDDSFYNTNFGTGIIQNAAAGQDDGNIYERQFVMQDVFVNKSNTLIASVNPLINIDFAYFPSERGMYNYNPDLTTDGRLKNPKRNFGSVMRSVSADNDFENSNVEILEFWMLNPFKDVVRDGVENKKNTTGGKILFHLGDVSEDVIPDGYNSFENGFPVTQAKPNNNFYPTSWGRAPKSQFLIDAFDNTTGAREKQDIGLEGLSDSDEKNEPHIAEFLQKTKTVVNPIVQEKLESDPSADNFVYFLDQSFDNSAQKGLLRRYKEYLGVENNSPENNDKTKNSQALVDQQFASASTAIPDKEDLNQDNTINDTENYYEYELNLKPSSMSLNQNFIVDRVEKNNAEWFLFRIPVKGYTRKVGEMNGFKSIRFIRVVATEWEQPVVVRMASMQLVGNSYRTYDKDIDNEGIVEVREPYDAQFKIGVINIEENGCDVLNGGGDVDGNCAIKEGKIPYVIPPGFERDKDRQQQLEVFFNEQSMTMGVTNLQDGDSRAGFKNINLRLVNYDRLKMFIHAEGIGEDRPNMGAFLRLGTDLSENYYEIEIPQLEITPNSARNRDQIWPSKNFIDVPLTELTKLKSARNRTTGHPISKPFTSEYICNYDGETPSDLGSMAIGNKYKLKIVGNPDLGTILTLMIGMRNPKDDGIPQTGTIWVDELRMSGYKQENGAAAIGTASIKLADLGTVTLNGTFTDFGFGSVQDRINMRAQENTKEFGITGSIDLDKLLPKNWNLKVPLYFSNDQAQIKPHFDPLNPDLTVDQALNDIYDPKDATRNAEKSAEEIAVLSEKRDKYQKDIQEVSSRKGFNLSNIRKVKSAEDTKSHFYDIENFTASYAQFQQNRHNVIIDQYDSYTKKGGLSYNYNFNAKNYEPFKNAKNLSHIRWAWLKDLNITPMPTVVAFRTDFDRTFGKTVFRNSDLNSVGVVPNFEKYFLMNRNYDAQWNLTKSINVSYTAVMNALVDEPYGEITDDKGILSEGTKLISRRDSLIKNLRTLGRAKLFDQKLNASYQIPLEKLYVLDWMTAQAVANTGFKYQASSFGLSDTLDIPFGNIISNSRDYGVQGRIDLVKLYNKVKYLKFANAPKQIKKDFARSPGDDEPLPTSKGEGMRSFTRILMAVRGIQFNYGVVETTTLPGFMQAPRYLGTVGNAPGLGFSMMGNQQRDFQERAAQNGWLTLSQSLPLPFIQTRQRKFDYQTSIEPFKDFKLQIKGNLSRGDNYQEFFRMNENGVYSSTTPVRNGQMSLSFWSFKTSFVQFRNAFKGQKYSNDSTRSEVFESLLQYRETLADRLMQGKSEPGAYNLNSQDVLIPAFFAAYSGKDPNKVKLNPFLKLPLPNWRFDYGRLADFGIFKRYFSSITLSHSYTSTYSVGNFTSSLQYGRGQVGLNQNGYPTATITSLEGYFIPVFMMSAITMQERFSPFTGIQFTTKKNVSGRLDYSQERNLALNLSNNTVTELSNHDFAFNVGYKKNKLKLPFRINGEVITLQNDVTFNFTWTIRDNQLTQRRLPSERYIDLEPDELYTLSRRMQGQYANILRFQVDYQASKRVQGSFYFDYNRSIPYTSNLYETRMTAGGLRFRFNLAE